MSCFPTKVFTDWVSVYLHLVKPIFKADGPLLTQICLLHTCWIKAWSVVSMNSTPYSRFFTCGAMVKVGWPSCWQHSKARKSWVRFTLRADALSWCKTTPRCSMMSPWASLSNRIEHLKQAVVAIPVGGDFPLRFKCYSGNMTPLGHKSCHHLLGSAALRSGVPPLHWLLRGFRIETIHLTFVSPDDHLHGIGPASIKSSRHGTAPLHSFVILILCHHVRHPKNRNPARMRLFMQNYPNTSRWDAQLQLYLADHHLRIPLHYGLHSGNIFSAVAERGLPERSSSPNDCYLQKNSANRSKTGVLEGAWSPKNCI